MYILDTLVSQELSKLH